MHFVACDVDCILQNRNGEYRIIIEKSCGAVIFTKENNDLNYIIIRSLESFCGFPKGHVEGTESGIQTALREVKEEAGVDAEIIKYVGKSQYNFAIPDDIVVKDVHWFLMAADNYHSKPQREEYFIDSGYYKFHEIYHLLKFSNEKQIVEQAYNEYIELKKANLWDRRK